MEQDTALQQDIEKETSQIIWAIKNICLFLECYLPLANAHVADFIVMDYWNQHVPDQISQTLLELNDTDLAKLPSGALYLENENVPINNFNSKGDYETRLEQGPEKTTQEQSSQNLEKPDWQHGSLQDFICGSKQNCIDNMKVLTDLTSLQHKWKCSVDEKVSIQQFMSAKKCHEVDIMAEVCSQLASYVKSEKVVDIGSGRGYLSSHLNLMYGLSVLAVDSSKINTNSAQLREQKLKKHWNGIVQNAKGVPQNMQLKLELEARIQSDIANDDKLSEDKDYSNTMSEHLKSEGTDVTNTISDHKNKASEISKPKCVSLTQFITPQTDLQELVAIFLCENPNLDDEEACNSRISDSKANHILTGLHTCGNLAPAMLDIFIHGKETTTALCNVGCCYHHLDEEFAESPYQSSQIPETFGFPLSTLLKSRCFRLGRNARMLASQTPARMAEAGPVNHTSLFYRALLQVILFDLTGSINKDWQVGKIFAKSKDFHDYVRKALKKLKIDDAGKLTDEAIDEYKEKYQHFSQKLSAFVQLRATLAPVIESLILLDRLLYLREHSIQESYIVKLFDEVKSPRCYGIIAIKEQGQ